MIRAVSRCVSAYRALTDGRVAGQMGFQRGDNPRTSEYWGSLINSGINGYLKIGIPLNEENSQNIAIVADYNYYMLDSDYGMKSYAGTQKVYFPKPYLPESD
jgi:hypothetical protein